MFSEYRKDILGTIISRIIANMKLLPGVAPDHLFKRLFERLSNQATLPDNLKENIEEVTAQLAKQEMLQAWRDGFADPDKLSNWRDKIAEDLHAILKSSWYELRRDELLSICYGKLENGPPRTYDPTLGTSLTGYLRGLVKRTDLELRCAIGKKDQKHISLDDLADQLADKRNDSDPCYDVLAREARETRERELRQECHDELDHRIVDGILLGKGPAEIAREQGEPEEKIKKRYRRLIQRVQRKYRPDQ